MYFLKDHTPFILSGFNMILIFSLEIDFFKIIGDTDIQTENTRSL